MRFLDELAYFEAALLIIVFSILSELSGQSWVTRSTVPGDRERFDQLAMDCRISLDMSLVSKQGVIPMGTGRELTKLIIYVNFWQ